jgi:hypothetical protein
VGPGDVEAAFRRNVMRGTQITVAAQASGSGKTKLAFMVGLDAMPTVIIRIGDVKPLLPPWIALDNDVRLWVADPSVPIEVKRGRMRLMLEALVYAYIEWTILVVEAFVRRVPQQEFSGFPGTDRRASLRQVVLLANRNRAGDDGVAFLVESRLAGLSLLSDASSLSRVQAAIMAYQANLRKRWNAVAIAAVGEPETLHVNFDEAQALLGRWTGLFVSRAADNNVVAVSAMQSETEGIERARTESDARRARDGLYGLLEIASTMHGYHVSMCGTHPDLIDRVVAYSRLNREDSELPVVPVTTCITTEDMRASLMTHLRGLGPMPDLDSVTADLRGRPVFFFRYGWENIVKALKEYEVESETGGAVRLVHRALGDRVPLYHVVKSALQAASVTSRRCAKEAVRHFVSETSTDRRTQENVLALAYTAAVRNIRDSTIPASADVVRAVNSGLLVAVQLDDDTFSNLFSELIIGNAVVEHCVKGNPKYVFSAIQTFKLSSALSVGETEAGDEGAGLRAGTGGGRQTRTARRTSTEARRRSVRGRAAGDEEEEEEDEPDDG